MLFVFLGRKLFRHSEDTGTVVNPGRESVEAATEEGDLAFMPAAAINTNPFSPTSPSPPSVDADQTPESHSGLVVQEDDSLTSNEGQVDQTAR